MKQGWLVVAISLAMAVVGYATAEQEVRPVQTPPLEIHIKHTEPRTVAVMTHKGPYEEIPDVIRSLTAQIEKGNHFVAGPVMVRYLNNPENVPPKELLWEVMIPVAKPGRLGGVEYDKMNFKYLDVMNVAYYYHIGPLEKVGESYSKMFGWLGNSGYEIVGPPMEIYWANPETTPKDKLVVELWIPISEERKPRVVR